MTALPPFQQAQAIIHGEAQALSALNASLDQQTFDTLINAITRAKGRVIVTGIGKSGLIAAKIAATLSSTGTAAAFMHMADAGHGDLGMVQPGDLVIVLSNSGQSRELIPVLTYCKRLDIPLVAMTSKAQSILGQSANHLLLIPDVTEACPLGLAPMSSTTMQLAMGDALAGALIVAKGISRDDFGKRHMAGSLGLRTMTIQEFARLNQGKIGDRDTPFVHMASALNDIISAITSGRVGAVLVDQGSQKAPGLITDGDLRRAMATSSQETCAQDIMTASPTIVEDTTLLIDAVSQMRENSLNLLVVKSQLENSYTLLPLHDLLREGL